MTDTPEPASAQQAPVIPPALPYTIKAHLGEYRRRLGVGRIILALALTAILYFRFGFWVWLFSAIAIVLIIFVILWVLGRRTLVLSDADIQHIGGFSARRTLSYSNIESAKVFLSYVEPTFGVAPRVTIAEKNSKTPLTLSALYWPVEEIDKLMAVLQEKKVKVEYYDQPVNSAMIVKEFPIYTSYIERHPFKIAAIATVAIIVVAVAIAVLITLN